MSVVWHYSCPFKMQQPDDFIDCYHMNPIQQCCQVICFVAIFNQFLDPSSNSSSKVTSNKFSDCIGVLGDFWRF